MNKDLFDELLLSVKQMEEIIHLERAKASRNREYVSVQNLINQFNLIENSINSSINRLEKLVKMDDYEILLEGIFMEIADLKELKSNVGSYKNLLPFWVKGYFLLQSVNEEKTKRNNDETFP